MGQAQIIPSSKVLPGFEYGSLVDRRITRGTLTLFDVAHSQGNFGAGVPVQSQLIPNLARAEAAAVLGSGDATTLSMTVFRNMIAQDGGMERTPKGGLHIAPARSGGTTNTNNFQMQLPLLVRGYARTNPAKSYYAGLVGCLTRGRVDGSAVAMAPLIYSNTTNRLVVLDEAGVTGADLGFSQTTTPLTVGQPFYMDGACAGWDGTVPPSDTGVSLLAGLWGAGVAWGAAGWGKGASWIFYSHIFECMDSSGLTYAQHRAKNIAQFLADFAVGGRYYGDTWTAPTTLAGS